jgi:hypothetical protein
MSKARVETLSDGVFAIAITLLVLTIAQPANYNHLAQELADRWPGFAAYVVSFAVIGIMWFAAPQPFSSPSAALYTITIGIAFISAYTCLAFHALLAVYYALDPLSRRAART